MSHNPQTKFTQIPPGQSQKSQAIRAPNQSQSNFQGSKIVKIREFEQNCQFKIQKLQEKLRNLNDDISYHTELLNNKRQRIRSAKLKNTKNEEAFAQLIKNKDTNNKFIKKKYNEAVAYNNEVRKQIDAIRLEKKLFDRIYLNLEKELDEKKDELTQVNLESNTILQDIKQSKTDYLRSTNKAFNTIKEQDKEYNEIYNIIENQNRDDKMKAQKDYPSMNIQEMLNPTKGEMSPTGVQRQDTMDQGKKFKKMNISGDLYNLDAIKAEVLIINQVQEYQQVFEILKSQENTNSIDEIVQSFVEIEDKQSSLLNFINAQNDEKDRLEKEKKSILNEIQQIQQLNQEKINDSKSAKVKILKKQIDEQKNIQKKIETKNKKLQSIINQLKIGIPIIFERIGCNFEEYQKEFLQTLNMKDFSENNMPFFLQFIEKQTNEIMQMYNEVFQNEIKESMNVEEVQPQNTLKENEFISTLDKLELTNQQPQATNDKEFFKKGEFDENAEKELAKMNIKKKKK